jgi:hypothetical protein
MQLIRQIRFVFFVILICAFVQNTFAQTPVPPREDHQFWNETQVVKHIGKRQDLVFIGVMRIGRDWQRPVDERLGAGWAFKLNKYLTVMPTYIHVEYQPYAGRNIHEERLVMNVTGKFTAKQFTFTDRNLIERRVRHGSPDFTVYRNRLQIDHPMHIGEKKFKGFVADEIWHSSQSGNGSEFGWFRNRLSVGVLKQLSEHFYSEIFLLYQSDGRSRPGNIPVVGTLFRYTL